MRKIKKFCISLLALLCVSCLAASCEYISPLLDKIFSQESASGSSNADDSSSPEESSSAIEENSSSIPEKDEENSSAPEYVEEHLRIVDEAYALPYGGTMAGTHTLKGVVDEITTPYSSSKGVTLIMKVRGREHKPIQCYRLKGNGADQIGVGDTITVTGTLKNYKGTVEFDNGNLTAYEISGGTAMPPDENDPYISVSKAEFYATYTPAISNEDAYYRSLHGFMSGSLTTPDQAPVISDYQPTANGKLIRNSETLYSEDGNAYTVVNAYGENAFTVYRSGAYITLEEVAAYVYAFGTYPKNYTVSKNTRPTESVWAEYLRLNHTRFSGDTSSYPYEPELPNITGCGGRLQYYEMDIGTTGTDCDPAYTAALYNNGRSITRGAARIVYGKNDLNGNGTYEIGELHVFYTYNHYNDFQEYLNYQGGWGEKFGNITGGGKISSKTDYNPTPYVPVSIQALPKIQPAAISYGYECNKSYQYTAYPSFFIV